MNDLPRKDESDFGALFHRAKDGDAAAVSDLVERYRRYLLLIANAELDASVQQKVGASDVVQEVVWTAQQHFEEFRGEAEGEWQAWLRVILQNDLRKTRRSFQAKRRDVRHEIPLAVGSGAGDHGFIDTQPTPATNALMREKAERLQAALAGLPDDYRQVIALRNFDHLGFEEIGQRLSRSADAARKLWGRAIQKLQHQLQNNAPELLSDVFESSSNNDERRK